MATASVRPASTVVLLRERDELEVFLVRRHDRIAFMGGAHVFPGGSVDVSDGASVIGGVCDGIETVSNRMPDLPRDRAVAFHVAAVRELFEEAGVILARHDGAMLAVDASIAPFAEYRRELIAGRLALRDIAVAEAVTLALDALTYFAHWITPESEPRRFDTRFFVAIAPDGQDAAHCEHETTDGVWLTPSDALARCRAGEIALPPPTWTTLRQIERHARAADVIAWARDRHVRSVQPMVIERGTARVIVLPGDPLHPAADSIDTPERRFLLEDGRWRPMSSDETVT